MPRMKRLAVFGWPPHSGEQLEVQASAATAERFGLVHISVGDIFRWHIQYHTKLGAQVKRIVASGNLVGDEIVAGIIADKIRIDGNGASSLLSNTEDENGASEGMVFSEGQLVMDDLWVAISDPENHLSSDAYLRVDSAIEDLNATLRFA